MERLSLEAFREKLAENGQEELKNINVIYGGNSNLCGDTASEYGFR